MVVSVFISVVSFLLLLCWDGVAVAASVVLCIAGTVLLSSPFCCAILRLGIVSVRGIGNELLLSVSEVVGCEENLSFKAEIHMI